MCADSPDQSGINAAALANANLSKESLDWYKQIYAESAPDRAKAAATNETVSNAQLEALNSNTALSNDYADYAKTTFRPMEQAIVANAQTYDTQSRRDSEAGKAIADVTQGFGNARDQNTRQQQRMGVNPSSGRMQTMSNQTAIAQAGAQAQAATGARQNVETQGYARKMDAANLGRNLASNQATSAGVALNAGNSAVGNAGQTLTQANQAASQMASGWSTAGNLNSSAGSLYGQAASMANQDSGLMGALGSVAGAYAGSSGGSAQLAKMFSSDINAKKNIKPVSDEQALKAVEKTPVSQWDYKAGEGDGGTHTGPMAQHVQQNMGEQAGPGGKMIDLVSLNGTNMAAIAALSRKVDKLAKAKGVAA